MQRIKSDSESSEPRSESRSDSSSLELICRNPKPSREAGLVYNSVEYFNTYIVPFVTPAHLPFKRNFVPAELWPLAPSIIQHILIVLTKTAQCSKSETDPLLNSDLCYYRGRSLTGLHKMLSDTATMTNDPYSVALMAVLFIMGADMQLCEDWTPHLEAARQIINLRGGLEKCLLNPLVNSGPLVNYLYADILTATSCNIWLLNTPAVGSQFEYLSILPNMEAHLITYGLPCPWQILHAITCTNILRVFSQRPVTHKEKGLMSMQPFDFDTVRDLLESFDPTAWAVRLSSHERTLPQRVGDELDKDSMSCLAALAECFKSAALLYLYLSMNAIKSYEERMLHAKAELSRNLRLLFDVANVDHEGPLHAQLWRFTNWPIVMSAYATVGFDVEGGDSVESDFDRFKPVMSTLSGARLKPQETFFRDIEQMRRVMKGKRPFKWDYGLGQRKAFAV